MIGNLKSNQGSAVPFILPIVFAVICLIAVLWEAGVGIYKISSVHYAMKDVALSVITENSDESYFSKREGYTGAFNKETDISQSIDVTDRLAKILNLDVNDSSLIKRKANDDVSYTLKNISLELLNTAPLDTLQKFKVSIKLDLLLNVKYPMMSVKEVPISLIATAENAHKF